MTNKKRVKHITINLTEEESDIIERLAAIGERKPADLARLLLMRQAVKEWGEMQPEGAPFTPLKFNQ